MGRPLPKIGAPAHSESRVPQKVFDSLLANFDSFSKLLTASDVSIVEGASHTMLNFIHFSMVQGIQKNDLLKISDKQMASILPAFKLDKQPIAKNLLKSLYWALTLGNSKFNTNSSCDFFRPACPEQLKRKGACQSGRAIHPERRRIPERHSSRSRQNM